MRARSCPSVYQIRLRHMISIRLKNAHAKNPNLIPVRLRKKAKKIHTRERKVAISVDFPWLSLIRLLMVQSRRFLIISASTNKKSHRSWDLNTYQEKISSQRKIRAAQTDLSVKTLRDQIHSATNIQNLRVASKLRVTTLALFRAASVLTIARFRLTHQRFQDPP